MRSTRDMDDAPLYARTLRLRHIRPGPTACFVLFEGSAVVAGLLALAELTSWWALFVLPATVAAMVKTNDLAAGAFTPRVGVSLAFAGASTPPFGLGGAAGPAPVSRPDGWAAEWTGSSGSEWTAGTPEAGQYGPTPVTDGLDPTQGAMDGPTQAFAVLVDMASETMTRPPADDRWRAGDHPLGDDHGLLADDHRPPAGPDHAPSSTEPYHAPSPADPSGRAVTGTPGPGEPVDGSGSGSGDDESTGTVYGTQIVWDDDETPPVGIARRYDHGEQSDPHRGSGSSRITGSFNGRPTRSVHDDGGNGRFRGGLNQGRFGG